MTSMCRFVKSIPFVKTVLATAFAVLVFALAPLPSQAQEVSAASRRIQSYYEQILPTIKQAGSLGVAERERRFRPAITSAFDLGTMARLAVGPNWGSFSGGQQAAIRDAFTRFTVAFYASQISDYSGESFVVEPKSSPSRGGGDVVKTKLVQPGGRSVEIDYLVRGGRIVDVYFNGTVSELATRRDEFTSIIASGGADALINSLKSRTQRLLGS